MRIAIDFDGTIVKQEHAYSDLATPLEFLEGAKEALLSLRRAGHLLLLWSGRASRALLVEPLYDPFVRAGAVPLDRARWLEARALHRARHQQMLDFVDRELPGVFHAVDDGQEGKPNVDLFIDDKAMTMRGKASWMRIARTYGEEEDIIEDVMPPQPAELLDRPVSTLNLAPQGQLLHILDSVERDLAQQGIVHFAPVFVLGEPDFWTLNRTWSINVPWFLANDELRLLAHDMYPYDWDDVNRCVRHEVGHAINYAFELWRLSEWTQLFGDFNRPYPKDDDEWKPDLRSPNFVTYLRNVRAGYGQKHPDEDWAETFAAWLTHAAHDPNAEGFTYTAGAKTKLEYAARVARLRLAGMPANTKRGQIQDYQELYRGMTVRELLVPPETNPEQKQHQDGE